MNAMLPFHSNLRENRCTLKMVLNDLLWKLYPFFYDRMRIFPSYMEMMEKVAESLSPQKNGIYLDLGCGTGNLILLLISKGAIVYGLDSSFSALKVAYAKIKKQKTSGSTRIHLYRFVDKLPFKDESLDGISAVNFISYIEPSSVQKLISEAKRVLKKGGRLSLVYVQTVAYTKGVSDYKLLIKQKPLQAITSTPFYLAVALMNLPMKLKTNITHYKKEYIENLMSKEGFKNIKTTPTYYGKTTLLTTGEKPAE